MDFPRRVLPFSEFPVFRGSPQIYLDSPEFQENKRMIEKIKSESLATKYDEDDSSIVQKEYATPWLYQLKVVTLRTFRSFWRQADYGFTWVVLRICGSSRRGVVC